MRTKVLLTILIFGLLLSGCACMGVSSRYCSDCYDRNLYYSYCDSDWHSSLCTDKPYSYVKIKRIDFPVDYRTRYEECCLPLTPVGSCLPGRC